MKDFPLFWEWFFSINFILDPCVLLQRRAFFFSIFSFIRQETKKKGKEDETQVKRGD
jgi:hypothetical protein